MIMDTRYRAVGLENLDAMCKHISGMAHRYWIDSMNAHRVSIGYSNTDEYGNENPMYAHFPRIGEYVLLDFLKVVRDSWQGEGWQAFQPLVDCPTLWRDPASGAWRTHKQIRDAGADNRQGLPDTCTICDLPAGA